MYGTFACANWFLNFVDIVNVKNQQFDDDESLEGDQSPPPIVFVPCSPWHLNQDPWGQAMPESVLQRVFHFAVKNDGPYPFLCRYV